MPGAAAEPRIGAGTFIKYFSIFDHGIHRKKVEMPSVDSYTMKDELLRPWLLALSINVNTPHDFLPD